MKIECPRRGKIAHSSVGYHTYTTQSGKNVCVNLAYKRSQSRILIAIFHHEHSWLGNIRQMIQPVKAVVITMSLHGRLGSPYADCGRIANHRRKIFEDAADTRVGKSFISQAYIESFDSVCHLGRAQLP